ncbi:MULTISPECIES: DUF378 domain-containing protein [Actinomycetes]|uniref:DUF378 domain-containing protein n=2 Tax=Streptosporangiales TaxID=85012 RepID=A0A2T0Q5E3_9ACTN|nr:MULTISPECIES: DUF378 domain-containing protein [Actinomycetes]MCK9868792.1 DUF378 domain-containing protein [Nocardiopsis dassonvillei]NKY96256.1 DUF378 domain-containing protein [Nocardiopsis alborubida]PRX98993.1 hypothetical protein CLV72_104573 [Allonocardiopsis opalescens]UCM89795.1 DUF378 domain-containing protein [Streptomyces marincola]
MRPQNALDWVAFVLLLIGAFAWGAFVTDVNVLDRLLEPIADPLDDTVFILIAAAGLYWIARVIGVGRRARQ